VNIASTRNRHRAVAAVAAGLLVLAACGGDDDDSASTEAGAAETTAAGGAETTADGGAETTADGGAETTTAEGTESAGSEPAGGGEIELADGDVFVTGSSTVEPISIRVGELANEMSGGGLAVTVEGPGTGDGFATFCTGGADIADASRAINDEEIAQCEENGVEYVELEVAIDGLTVATSPANEAITCLDVPALYALVGPESEGLANWSDTSELATELESAYAADFPDAPLDINGPGEESGTYDTFVEFAIADLAEERGQDEATRADYSSSPNDNLIVEGIEASESSLGWVGFAYYAAEQERMKAIEIDGGDGCVAPSVETAQDGTYKPLSRPLFVYVKQASFDKPEVHAFVEYLIDNAATIAEETQYVPLTQEQIDEAKAAFESAAGGGSGGSTTGTTG
jgi:phosphate transport system substrate-binding protein